MTGVQTCALPIWFAVAKITPKHSLGCITRSDSFAADESVKDGPTPKDYVKSGYDKGHQIPDGDLSWNSQIEHESFLMTNMAPQAGSFNRGIWKLLETAIRSWTVTLGQTFIVYVGAVYNSNDKRIGQGVIVPHAYYKMAINEKTGEYAAWMFPHVAPYPNLGSNLTKFRVSIAQIQKESGVTFSLPSSGKELAIGKEWLIDYGRLTKEKRKIGRAHV